MTTVADNDGAVQAWATHVGMAPHLGSPWAVALRLSTVPMDHWFYRRKALKPEDLQLDIAIPSYGLWCATLLRHDGLFMAQWRPGGRFNVESQQMKYTRLTPWPAMASLMDFPALAGALEKALSVRFIRHANLGANGLADDDLEHWAAAEHGSSAALRQWLAPCADTLGTHYQAAPASP